MDYNTKNERSIDIFKAIQLSGIYIGKNISIKINNKINHFERIKKLFDNHGISHICYTPESNAPNRFDLHFGSRTDFQDLYIIIAILKNFGLQSVFLSRDDNNQVTIGSYITECSSKRDISEGIDPNTVLELPFMLTTDEFLNKCFKINRRFENPFDLENEFFGDEYDLDEDIDMIFEDEYDLDEEMEVISDVDFDFEEDEYGLNDANYNYSSNHNESDYERDTFDALTDGQYDDYEDWKEDGGDIDSLRDSLGY